MFQWFAAGVPLQSLLVIGLSRRVFSAKELEAKSQLSACLMVVLLDVGSSVPFKLPFPLCAKEMELSAKLQDR